MPNSELLKPETKRRGRKSVRWSIDQLVEHVRKYNIRTFVDVGRVARDMKAQGVVVPTQQAYRRRFGEPKHMWKTLMYRIWGEKSLYTSQVSPYDRETLAQTVIKYGLWSTMAWNTMLTATGSGYLPTLEELLSVWGKYQRLVDFARAYSLKEVMQEVWTLWEKKGGRFPTWMACERAGIDTYRLRQLFLGRASNMRKFFDALKAVHNMEQQNADGKGSQEQDTGGNGEAVTGKV